MRRADERATDTAADVAEQDDREALLRVAAGDVSAFAPLVARHEARIVGLCHRMLGEREAARDAAQEVFVKAFRKAGSFRPRGQVFTWLYRIAVNHCLNQLRRRKIVRFLSFGDVAGHSGAHGEDERVFDPPDAAADAESRLVSRRRWQATRARIEALPEGQRAVLVLAKLEGLRYRQIAEVLGITESAVESRLFRAMQRLTKAQENDG